MRGLHRTFRPGSSSSRCYKLCTTGGATQGRAPQPGASTWTAGISLSLGLQLEAWGSRVLQGAPKLMGLQLQKTSTSRNEAIETASQRLRERARERENLLEGVVLWAAVLSPELTFVVLFRGPLCCRAVSCGFCFMGLFSAHGRW